MKSYFAGFTGSRGLNFLAGNAALRKKTTTVLRLVFFAIHVYFCQFFHTIVRRGLDMPNMQADEIYEKGLNALTNDHVYLALVCFEQATALEKTPLYCSHLAFCLAKVRGQHQEAIDLCKEALEKDPDNALHYLNLGRIYILSGQKEKALQTMREGLRFEYNQGIILELEKLGTRKNPVIPSLKREHPLNKFCGMLLKKLGCR